MRGIKLTSLCILSVITACSPTPQDSGDEYSAPISGRVVDGYIANAKVFVDTNKNGILDPWEPRAITDKEGYFGYNSKSTGVDYCGLDDTDNDYVYCLKLPPLATEMMIQITDGYDLTTGEPFAGTISSWATRGDDVTLPGNNTASPISSLLSYMTPAARLEYAALEGFTADELKIDPLVNLGEISDAGIESKRRSRINLAMQIQKTKDVISAYLATLYKDSDGTTALFGNNEKFPADPSHYVMKTMADTLVTSATPVSVASIFADSTLLWEQVIAVRDAINEDVSANSLQPDATLDVATPQDIATRMVEFNNFVDALFSVANNSDDLASPGNPLSDSGDIQARLKAVEVVTTLLRDPTKANLPAMDPAAQRAIDLALGTGSAIAADATNYLYGLSSSKADIRRLVENFQANGAAVAANASDFINRRTMSDQIGGGTLGTDLMDVTLTSSRSSSNTAAMVFNPDGGLVAAISYTDPDNPANNISADQPLDGTWEQINDYTMLAHIEVGGEIRPMIIRTDSDGTGYLFDFGGEIVEWQ